jgi:hypothetical protein
MIRDFWNWNTVAKYLIRRNSPYSVVRVVADMSRRNSQQRYVPVLVAIFMLKGTVQRDLSG